mmetsp:Transcript_47287/g.95453  ORF Transcript_47287/g.95453 Transcript_47287/m.95453 type:complete len:294 (-) Transcript_47287:198-1079(-)
MVSRPVQPGGVAWHQDARIWIQLARGHQPSELHLVSRSSLTVRLPSCLGRRRYWRRLQHPEHCTRGRDRGPRGFHRRRRRGLRHRRQPSWRAPRKLPGDHQRGDPVGRGACHVGDPARGRLLRLQALRHLFPPHSELALHRRRHLRGRLRGQAPAQPRGQLGALPRGQAIPGHTSPRPGRVARRGASGLRRLAAAGRGRALGGLGAPQCGGARGDDGGGALLGLSARHGGPALPPAGAGAEGRRRPSAGAPRQAAAARRRAAFAGAGVDAGGTHAQRRAASRSGCQGVCVGGR